MTTEEDADSGTTFHQDIILGVIPRPERSTTTEEKTASESTLHQNTTAGATLRLERNTVFVNTSHRGLHPGRRLLRSVLSSVLTLSLETALAASTVVCPDPVDSRGFSAIVFRSNTVGPFSSRAE